MFRAIFTALLMLCVSQANAYNLLFPGPLQSSRTINWSYDGSCSATAFNENLRATRILDRVLPHVTINYQGVTGTGFNNADTVDTVSCHSYTWFADGTGTLHRVAAPDAGAFSDHTYTNGVWYFDMAFRDEYCCGAALHEWTHVLGLDHPPMASANHWSAVYGDPFGFLAPSAANPYMSGWTEYLSNDDLVGLSTYYLQSNADCTPYLSLGNKLYLPYIPTSANGGNPDPNNSTTGYWAVLQYDGTNQLSLLEYGTATTFPYSCAIHYGGTTITATGYREATQSMTPFTMTNNDTTGISITNWTIH